MAATCHGKWGQQFTHLKLGDGEVYDNVKEEAKESFVTNTTEDLVCIKFKIEKQTPVKQKSLNKPGGKRKENVTLKTLREREKKTLT